MCRSDAETIVALPDNVHGLTQQACCCESVGAAAGRRQLNDTAQTRDRQTDRQTELGVTRKWPSSGGPLKCHLVEFHVLFRRRGRKFKKKYYSAVL